LCLFDEGGAETRIPLRDHDAGLWHAFVPGIGAGQAYGYRATGPYDPARGLRCNPAKLLLDPYARAFSGTLTPGPEVFGYSAHDQDAPSAADSAASVPRSLVIADEPFGWRDDARPRYRLSDTVMYELHVKGFTMRHPDIPPELRGTYAGLAHEAAIAHLTDLGVTTVELLPVHESGSASSLVARGLTNYWGYNAIGYFAPHQRYSAAVRAGKRGGQVREFKAMVNALHMAGLEVLLDVAFSHTAEGNDLGPTVCYRGLDNPAYYRLDGDDPRYYVDTTGTGNSLNAGHPVTLQLIMDSLRYWLTEMHVDGFRLDLASTLGRADDGFAPASAFLDLAGQDPVVSRAKLVTELSQAGQIDRYDLGRFPWPWCEWNARYRDTMRDFWRSQRVALGEFATRFRGSPDLYADPRRTTPVNLITVHDGFTLRDLVSYNDKHNEANGEANNDGTSDNRSWNGGAEGATADPVMLELRARQSRAMLATLMLSSGVPLLLGGDEMGRTQQGNNNAYCQDNEISWVDWSRADTGLLDFTRRLVAFRRAHPVFRRRRFPGEAEAAEWRGFTPAGPDMTAVDWSDTSTLAVALYLDGSDHPDQAADGSPWLDDDFLVLVNARWEPREFVLPATRDHAAWRIELDTYGPTAPGSTVAEGRAAGDHITVSPRSLVVLSDRARTASAEDLRALANSGGDDG
ncbi:MAG: glycogen debranching protein GlgX, partial [Streptosporangiaceae bacterium]